MPSPTSHFFLLFQQSTVAFFDRMMIYGALDMAVLFNCIAESESDLMIDPYLNAICAAV